MTNPTVKAPAIPVRPNMFKKLPAANSKFRVAVNWKAAENLDFDFWLLRIHKMPDGSKVVEVLAWPFEQYNRPDLGRNSQGFPFQAFPELDVISKGDDRTGGESDARKAKGEEEYDEGADFDLSKAPDTVIAYVPFVTIYDEHDAGLTLAHASEVQLIIEDMTAGTRFATDPAQTDGTAISYVPGTVKRSDDGKTWEIHGTQDENARGTTDNAWVVANAFGANVQTP